MKKIKKFKILGWVCRAAATGSAAAPCAAAGFAAAAVDGEAGDVGDNKVRKRVVQRGQVEGVHEVMILRLGSCTSERGGARWRRFLTRWRRRVEGRPAVEAGVTGWWFGRENGGGRESEIGKGVSCPRSYIHMSMLSGRDGPARS